ncbi:MAG: hypothetical protein ABI461_06945 [Polyangiaceae bacterium]
MFAPTIVLAVGCGARDGSGFAGDSDPGKIHHDGGASITNDAGSGGESDASSDGGAQRDAAADASGLGVVDAGVDGGSSPTDSFDANACPGPAMSAARAATLLGTSVRAAIANATFIYRERTCPDAGACTSWTATAPLVLTLLTYSGGVTTNYKNFAFPLMLVLWNHESGGSASYGLTVRHSTDYAHDTTGDLHGVAFPFGTTSVRYPLLYLWDDHPDHPDDYPDPEAQWYSPATLTATDSCARFYIDDVQTAGFERQMVAVFHY